MVDIAIYSGFYTLQLLEIYREITNLRVLTVCNQDGLVADSPSWTKAAHVVDRSPGNFK